MIRGVTTTVRDAHPADLPAILQMVRDLAEFERLADEVAFDPDEFGRHVFGPDPVVTVNIAEVDGEVAGMALWFRTFSTFLGKPGIWLEDLYVHPPSGAAASAARCCATSAPSPTAASSGTSSTGTPTPSPPTTPSAPRPTTAAGSPTAGRRRPELCVTYTSSTTCAVTQKFWIDKGTYVR